MIIDPATPNAEKQKKSQNSSSIFAKRPLDVGWPPIVSII